MQGGSTYVADSVPFWPLDPGSGIGSRRSDPKPIFWELIDNFLDKKFYNSLKIGPNYFLQHFKNKIILWNLWLQKIVWQLNFFTPFFCCCFWIWYRDLGSGMGKNQDPGSGINILDPQHWAQHWKRRWDGWIEIEMRKTEQKEGEGKCGKGG